ncbi:MAG TPA: DNA translocase FtsK [Nitrospiria bacterium]|nr:DNA translocase FtsK [Nitrospiria bacterium]
MAKAIQSGYRRHEILGVLFLAIGLLLLVSLISYDPLDPSLNSVSSNPSVHNLAGKVGAYLSDELFQLIGGSAYLLAIGFGLIGWRKLLARPIPFHRWKVAGFALLLTSSTALLHLLWTGLPSLAGGPILAGHAGGLLGKLTADWLSGYFAPLGAYILVTAAVLLSLIMTTSISLLTMMEWAGDAVQKLVSGSKQLAESAQTALTIYQEQSRRWKTEDKIRQKWPPQKPKIVDAPAPPKAPKAPPRQADLPFMKEAGDYELPPLTLLQDPPASANKISKEELLANSQILEKKLMDYGIEGRVTQVHPGPVVTMYEFEPAPGVKVNRIVNLSDDLALAMRAMSVRIVAPLPGKSVVGIEIPNTSREDVYLKEILTAEAFTTTKSKLTLALGKDIFGTPIVADLAGMPHLLVAGATGSGKSVALNTMILSLLYSATPEEVKFIMIDPKLLELSAYDGIPHLQTPVLVRAKDTPKVFQRLVAEMQQRFRLLAEAGARNIESYNKKLREQAGEGPGRLARATTSIGSEESPDAQPPQPNAPLPYLVVIVDELADLMLVAAREIEDSIARLAQMARAAGIHLILATQRPSVDVLTGLIKANFPARISFQVSSKTDSRTILDANGAEQLLGRGDMLFLAPGTGRITRIHGAYVSENEIRAIVDHVKSQGKPQYIDLSSSAHGGGSETEESDANERDALYEKAVEMVVTSGAASASLIQRRLRVGYPRAARMIEMMEEDGIVGPAAGGKPREVLSRRDEPVG